MEFRIVKKDSFVLVGYSAAGKWDKGVVHPIPDLWDKSTAFIRDEGAEEIIGVCLPPRSDQYFYTCGMEMESVNFHKITPGMTVHTFPAQTYMIFTHVGPDHKIPSTYANLWRVFDKEGYRIKKGMPELEVVKAEMFGKEETEGYVMDIWIPVE